MLHRPVAAIVKKDAKKAVDVEHKKEDDGENSSNSLTILVYCLHCRSTNRGPEFLIKAQTKAHTWKYHTYPKQSYHSKTRLRELGAHWGGTDWKWGKSWMLSAWLLSNRSLPVLAPHLISNITKWWGDLLDLITIWPTSFTRWRRKWRCRWRTARFIEKTRCRWPSFITIKLGMWCMQNLRRKRNFGF